MATLPSLPHLDSCFFGRPRMSRVSQHWDENKLDNRRASDETPGLFLKGF